MSLLIDPETRCAAAPSVQRELDAVGYFAFKTPAFDEWIEMLDRVVRADVELLRSDTMARVRLDGKIQRILLERHDAPASFSVGLQAKNADARRRLESTLNAQGLKLHAGSAQECEARGVEDFYWFLDPDGNRIEIFTELADAPRQFRSRMPIGGFRTGELGAGHLVLFTTGIERMSNFYRGVLGFSLSDYTTTPFRAEFMHINPRHHSLALIEGKRCGIQHIMLEYLDWDDVGRAYDEILRKPELIGQSLGRHSNDLMTSFYFHSPDRFMIELGWSGRLIGPDWRAEELIGPSLWGHERYWLPEEGRARARIAVAKYAELGVRQPVARTKE